MRSSNQLFLFSFAIGIVALLYLVSCATPPPTQELAAAEAAVAEAQAAGCPDCAPEACAAAESALAQGKALAGEFCSELEARRMLIDARAKAEEAKIACTMQVPPPPPLPPDLKDIFFDFDRFNIRPDAAAVLEENTGMLKANPNVSVLIEGYADIRGNADYNLRLALNRANATKDFLVNIGVDPSRIETSSGGATQQFAAGRTGDAYQLNRRSHFIVTMPPEASIGARLIFIYNE